MVGTNKPNGFFGKRTVIVFISLFSCFFLFACSGATKISNNKNLYLLQYEREVVQQQEQVEKIMETAFSQVGKPYKYGGNSPSTGFDCSGFVKWVYGQFGVDLPRTSRSMQKAGTEVAYDDMKPGDLIFFNYRTFHVGIYTGDGKYIHSPRTGKTIQEDSLNENGRGNKIAGIRRVIENDKIRSISDSLKDNWVSEARTQMVMVKAKKSETKSKIAAVNKGKNNSTKPKNIAKTQQNVKLVQHKVVKGDTIYDLAKQYKISQKELLEVNKLNKSSKLKLGQKLVVPKKK